MKKSKAIKILRVQLEKLDKKENQNYNWIIETRTYIDLFFGKESHQSKIFFNMTFVTSSIININEEENLENVKSALINCISAVENIGVYKKPKNNFMSRIPDGILVLILSAIGSGAFIIGKYTSDLKNIRLQQEIDVLNKKIDSIEKSPIIISTPSDSIASKP